MIREEMKKLLTWKRLLLILVVTVFYFILFLHSYVVIYEGSYRQEADIAKAITGQYGTEITEDEYGQMKQDIPFEGKEKMSEIAAGLKGFQEKGITDIRELVLDETMSPDEKERLWSELYESFNFIEPRGDMSSMFTDAIELTYWQTYLDGYRTEVLEAPAGSTEYYDKLNDRQQLRVEERNKEEVRSVLPAQVVDTNFEVLQFWAPLMVLAVLLLVLPYMVGENRSNMTALLYSTPRGRKYYAVRMKAVLLSCLVLIVVYIGLYAAMAKINRVFDFWNTPISAYTSGFISWFPWTLGQVTAAAVICSAAAALGAGLLSFVITTRCGNYITAIAGHIPLFLAGISFGIVFLSRFTEITGIRGLGMAVSGICLCAGAAGMFIQYVLEKRRNVG